MQIIIVRIEISRIVGFPGNYSGDDPVSSRTHRIETDRWLTAINRNGVKIIRHRINAPFKVVRIIQERVTQRLGTNSSIHVGDIVDSINSISLATMTNEEVCLLLRDIDVASIVNLTLFSGDKEHNL